MIPATHWADGDDGTAWWVPFLHDGDPDIAPGLDRPCDTCGDQPTWTDSDDGDWFACPDCDDGTGRHTFDVEVACIQRADLCGHESCGTHRVSVVPGMVLPIVAWDDQRAIASGDHFIVTGSPTDPTWAKRYERGEVGRAMHDVTLPPAAAPGMWAVQLRKADR